MSEHPLLYDDGRVEQHHLGMIDRDNSEIAHLALDRWNLGGKECGEVLT